MGNRTVAGWALIAGLLAMLLPAAGAAQGDDIWVETDELDELMAQPNTVLLDAKSPDIYERAHIPGAINLHYLNFADIETRSDNGFPVSPDNAEKLLGEAGVSNETTAIIYDGGQGPPASGLWFAMRFFGHDNVKILDGGFRKWLAEDRPVTQKVPEVKERSFSAKPHPDMVATIDEVKANLRGGQAKIVDNRSLEEFIGENVLPNAARGGHIPRAQRLEWQKLSGELATRKEPRAQRQVMDKAGLASDDEIIAYCQSGIGRSTFFYLMAKQLGYPNVRVFTGSWEEWSANSRLPVEK
ncbi:MAG: sulfurtransferase [Gammaproteobacteria bacterium]|nr:sulfurtransferase [Gammaproteobacteria bacterium]